LKLAIIETGGAMKAREYLEQYQKAVDRIRRYQEEYDAEKLLIDAIRSPSDNDGMPHGNGISKPTEDKAERLSLKALDLVEAKLEAIAVRQEIFNTIMQLSGLECDVLIERYVKLKRWEDVCLAVHYSWNSVRLAWHRGEDIIQEIINARIVSQ